jgi:prepilin-type N-terminal cleavage/methylation domain-containing protein
MMMQRRRSSPGFTIIELLVAMGIIGILAAIAIWNYYLGIQKARQKRTMADIRAVATAWEARAVDTRGYNGAAAGIWPSSSVDKDQLNLMLVPTYIKILPQYDGWSRAFELAVDVPVGDTATAFTYGIRSYGRDGIPDNNIIPGATTNFDCDIVYMNGTFVVYPEGLQQQ